MAKTTIVKMNNTNEMESRKRLYELTMRNCQKIGNKVFAFIPAELLFIDTRFQRLEESSSAKIRKLAEHWDDNKMDALKVSAHDEEYRFSILDGCHRKTAGEINNITEFACELVQGFSNDLHERLYQEAKLFATQNDDVDKVTPIQKHKANVLLKIPANVILQETVDKYGVQLKKHARGHAKIGFLSGFYDALRIAKVRGKENLDDTFNIICNSSWNLAKNGFAKETLKAISTVIACHSEDRQEVKKVLIEYFTPIEPDRYFSSAMEKYPERTITERNVMFLEDILFEKLGITKIYTEKVAARQIA